MKRIKVEQTINWEFDITDKEYKDFKGLENDFEKFEFLEFEGEEYNRDADNYKFEEVE